MEATNLAGKVVVVTEASRSIGREIALLCGRLGASVVVNDYGGPAGDAETERNPALEVVSEIQSAGDKGAVNGASIADAACAQSIIDDALKHFGRIDAVVNDAGILRDRMSHKVSIAAWRHIIDIHLNGYFYVSRAAANYFKEQGSGSYVHFTSTSGLFGNLEQANYAAAKMGIVGLSTSIALDLQRYRVRSNCIALFAWSRMTASIPAETEADKKRVERLKSMSTDKIAPLVAFLCSDASKDTTGQIFCIRKDEIFLFSMPRPIRSRHRDGGWNVESIARDLAPAFRPSFQPLQLSSDVFSWDPV